MTTLPEPQAAAAASIASWREIEVSHAMIFTPLCYATMPDYVIALDLIALSAPHAANAAYIAPWREIEVSHVILRKR